MGRRITSYMNGGKTKGVWGLLTGAHGGSIKLNIVSQFMHLISFTQKLLFISCFTFMLCLPKRKN